MAASSAAHCCLANPIAASQVQSSKHTVCFHGLVAATRSAKAMGAKAVHLGMQAHTRRQATRASAVSVVASVGDAVGENPDHFDSDYVVLGLAQCYVKDEDSKLQEVLVIEPIPAAAVECMDNGGVTSYRFATGSNLGVALKEDTSLLPAEFAGARFCDEFDFRAKCCARTWKRQHAQEHLLTLVPEGVVRSDFNFSTEDKRVLNMENEVSDSDNIKQDISIDVYGRTDEASTDVKQEDEIQKLYNA